MGEEQPGQVADRLRLEEIELHEAFDRRFARPIGIIPPPRDLALHVEGQSVLRPLRARMEMAAHRPRSEARRVGNACVSTCRSRWSPYHKKKNQSMTQTIDVLHTYNIHRNKPANNSHT